MKITDGYLVSKLEFRTDPSSSSSAVDPQEGMYYRDLYTKRIVVWDVTTNEFRDLSFFQGYRYTKFQNEDRIDSNRIYLAKPGQRILGVINGVDEDSCSLTKNLNNTSELTFTVERIIDGEETQYYEQIQRHYELYIPYHGWFKINEEPEIDNDGTQETKSVRAESLEIELQQYDLVDFDINTGSEYSKEMLATDNTYDNNGYNAFHDQVLFYRDTTALEAAIEEFAETDGSVSALKDFITQKGTNYGCWRITLDDNNEWQIESKIDPQSDDSEDYTGMEILENELDRQNKLSLLWLILHEHGWNVGFVDPYVDAQSEIEDDRIPLANKVGFFQVDSQDIYSFLTQQVAQYFRCIFVFDTENYLVHAYNVNNIGYDTNIFLSFRNVQNEVTRTSDKDLHTVFHVQGGDDLDFTEANFGENQIEDISYFLTTEHFDQEFIDKYNAWQAFREEKRQEYMALSVQFRDQTDVVNELTYRVPVDAADGSQYKTMTEDELINEKANIRAMRYGFEHSVLYAQTDEHGDPIKDEDGNYVFDINKMMESVDWPVYSSLVNIVLSDPDDEEDEAIDHIVFVQGQESDEYEYDFETSYKETYPNARLGQIDIALLNRRIIDGYYVEDGMTDLERAKRTNVKNQKEFLDDYLFHFETYGYLYGLEELKNFEQSYYGTLSALEDTGYNESDGTVYDRETYAKYLKYKNALESVQAEKEVRQAEVDEAQEDLDEIVEDMNEIKELVSMEDWTGTIEVDGNEVEVSFTEDELALLDKYYLHTDYTNQDIITTSISTNQQIVDTENQLYLDAMEELYVESHPQYQWTTTQDNLLLMPELHDWHGDLHVGNFIRISFRDDYQVKLRVSSITLNPLMLEPTIELQFTSMTQYKSKRNDFTAILDQANSSTKNSITSSISKKSGTDNQVNVDSALILKLLNSSTFQGYMGSNNANITGSTINAVSGNIQTIATNVINAMDINVSRITGTQAQFDELFTNYLKSNLIVTKMINAQNADIENLTAKIITVGGTQITEDLIQTAQLSADQITSGTIDTNRINVNDVIRVGTNSITTIAEGVISTAEISADQITSGTISTNRINVNDVITVGTNAITTIAEGVITTENVVATLVSATSGDFDDLTADSAFIQYLNSGIIEAGTVSADAVIAALVEAEEGDFDSLTSDSAFIQYLNSNLIIASEIRVDDLKAKLAQVDTLTAGSAFVTYLQGLSSTVAQSTITDAYIYNAVANKISVADLAAGNIVLTNTMKILSENGQMVMNGSALQIMGEDSNGDPYVGIQLGYDTNENPSLILRNEDGATILTPEGITSDAVADGLIVNNMIHDGTIARGKLGFPIVETNQDGTINITSIKDGSGGNFGVEYTTFKQGTSDALDQIRQDIEDSANYDLYIETPNGTNIWGGNIQLNVKLLKNNVDVTNDFDASCFIWTRTSRDHDADLYWNSNHSQGAKVVTITANDVRMNADFQCKFEYENVTVVAD